MLRVEGKVALVTGAARGLGRATALKLATEGADVAIWELAVEGAQETAEMVEALGRRAVVQAVDVTRPDDVYVAASRTIEELGKIDILVNNAGIASAAPTLLDLDDDRWLKEVSVNLSGTYFCTKAVLGHMIERRSGKIVNISSMAGEFGRQNTSAGYSASKAGVLGLTMSVAASVAKHGINVNAVCPGVIITEFHKIYSEEQLKALQVGIPFNRGGVEGEHGKPEDIANAVLFLASSEADYITGTRLRVNGGSLMG
jgi:3-oxoacyl-[acyl-carrier protein] reductase